MEAFLLELGAGFAFVARQKRLIIDDEDFYLDLLFYHLDLRRFIAIEPKLDKFTAAYKGQMELNLRWINRYERRPRDEPPIGLILCSQKSYEQIELLQLDKGDIRVAEYLPNGYRIYSRKSCIRRSAVAESSWRCVAGRRRRKKERKGTMALSDSEQTWREQGQDNPFSLANQVGIVTGGGQGLGKVFCHAFAQAGADLVVVDCNAQTGPETVREIEAKGRAALFVPADISQYAAVQNMVAQAVDCFGRIDFLMNNAGITIHKAAEETTEEEWRKVLDVNLTGLFFCCQLVGQQMIQRFEKEGIGGRIINIASMSGLIVNRPQAQASYNVSKAGVIHLTRSLAVEWARYQIRVNAIAPGYMNTTMAEPFFANPAFGGVWLDGIPLKRWGEPKELGPLAVFLASEASSYITGATMVADGGYTAL